MSDFQNGFNSNVAINSNSWSSGGNNHPDMKEFDGPIYYEVYGVADSGFEETINRDNLYMNGVYMKSFQFSHYSKGVKAYGENSLFAICGHSETAGKNESNASMEVMNTLDSVRQEICKMTAEEAARYIRMFCENICRVKQNEKLSFGILYITPTEYVAFSVGGICIKRTRGKALKTVGFGENNRNVFLGDTVVKGPEIRKATGDESFLICPFGILNDVPNDIILDSIIKCDAKQAVSDIADKALAMCGNRNISLMVVNKSEAEQQGKAVKAAKSKSKVIPIIIACVLVIGIIATAGYMLLVPKEETEETVLAGESLDAYNERISKENTTKELIPAIEEMMDALKKNRDDYKALLEKCKAGGVDTKDFEAKLNDFSKSIDDVDVRFEKAKKISNANEQLREVEACKTLIQKDAYDRKSLVSLDNELKTAATDAEKALNEKNQADNTKNTAGSSSSSGSSDKSKSSGSSGSSSKSKSSGGSGSSGNSKSSGGSSGGSSSGSSSGTSSNTGGSSSTGSVAAPSHALD